MQCYFSEIMAKKLKAFHDDDLDDFQDAPIVNQLTQEAKISNMRTSQISKDIAKLMTVKLVGGLGVVDFYPAPNIAVIYLSEGDIICGVDSLLGKVKKLKKLVSPSGRLTIGVIFLRTEISSQYFETFQNILVLENSFVILPITNQEQVAQVIHQMFVAETHRNPFLAQSKPQNSSTRLHKDLLHAVCKIPGMGEKRSRTLLQKLDSIRKIARARQPELTPILGPNLARGVEDFFRKRNTI